MPSQIGVKAKRKDKILNTHYFNPPYLIPLVELIRSPDTSDETVTVTFDLLTAIGKRLQLLRKKYSVSSDQDCKPPSFGKRSQS